MIEIKNVGAYYNFNDGTILGDSLNVETSYKKLSAVREIYFDKDAFDKMNQDMICYHVSMHLNNEVENKEGGLLFGTSFIHPGKVGNEFFMTKGHFHHNIDTSEYYFGVAGEGLLLLQDEAGNVTFENVSRGSLHYIKGRIAHRLINTGKEMLVVGACWPSNAGHDYSIVNKGGFNARVIEENGQVKIIENK